MTLTPDTVSLEEVVVHPEAPARASFRGRVTSAREIRARYQNGVVLLHTGWASGRGFDRDSVWVARREKELVGVWHATPVMVQECWTIGSGSTRDSTLVRFADWRSAVRSLDLRTTPPR